jgi:multiple sugar transport system ATP-binding protein
MRDGRIQQVDTPQALYRDPTNLFVAAFIGSPSMNLVEATIRDGVAEFGGLRIPLDDEVRPGYGHPERVILGIRPEAFEDAQFADERLPRIDVTVSVLEELGSDAHVIFPLDAPRVEAEELRAAADEEEEGLIADDRRTLFNARVDARTNARTGRKISLAVNPAGFHFFDPATGESLAPGRAAALV